jgi:hypothetical protein
MRVPVTMDELAQELDRRPETLTRWQRSPGFEQAVDDAIRQRLDQRKADTYEVIGEKAEAGDFRFVKLMLELWGHYPARKISAERQAERKKSEPFGVEKYREALDKIAVWEKERYGHVAMEEDRGRGRSREEE